MIKLDGGDWLVVDAASGDLPADDGVEALSLPAPARRGFLRRRMPQEVSAE